MEHRQIELFLAMAERLNITDAADASNISQPGLSKSMQRLQRELGARLYCRRGQGIELTEAGRVLLRHAKRIELQLCQASEEVRGVASGALGHARVGAGPSWVGRHVPEAIASLVASHPNLRFTVRAGFPETLIQQLRRGELDLVVAALPDRRTDPDLRFSRLTTDAVRVVPRAGHTLLGKAGRTLADVAACHWVLPGRHEVVRQRLAEAFRAEALPEPVAAVESDSVSFMVATLRGSDLLGLATMSSYAMLGLMPLEDERLCFSREAGIITRRHGEVPESAKLLAAQLRRTVAGR